LGLISCRRGSASVVCCAVQLQQQGGALDIDVGDLTPEEYEAMRKLCLVDEEAAAPEADAATSSAPAGRQQHPNGGAHPPAPVAVPGPPQPGGWHPWWRLPEAAELQLNAHGQPLVADLSGGAGASASGRQLPAPPEAPLPALSSLTRAEPSPLLRWQLLQALYSYCLTERLLGGDWGASPPDAAEHVLLLAPALQPPAAAGSAAGVQAGGPADVRTTLMECCTRACQPPTGHPSQRGAALSACADVAWLLQLGRAPLLLALTDLGGRMAAGGWHSRSRAACDMGAGGGTCPAASRPASLGMPHCFVDVCGGQQGAGAAWLAQPTPTLQPWVQAGSTSGRLPWPPLPPRRWPAS